MSDPLLKVSAGTVFLSPVTHAQDFSKIIAAVAMLLIHIDKKAVAFMKLANKNLLNKETN